MADDERQDEKSLELPSLRSPFRRRRPAPAQAPPAEAYPSEPEPTATVVATTSTQPPRTPGAGQEGAEPSAPAEPGQPSRRSLLPSRLRKAVRVHVPGPVAALTTGLVVGLVVVGLTAASLRLCASWRGTSSCGKPGFLLLLALTVVAILVGSLLLRTLGVGASASTSFLGVGLLVVLILLALLPTLGEWWVVIVVPLVAMLTYLASWWITTTYSEPGERPH